MKNKTAIVTGGSRGIGRAVAIRLAAEGANIVLNYKGNDTAAEETKKLCEAQGVRIAVFKGDVANEEDCIALVEFAINEFGSVDILVNNAGITRDSMLARMSPKQFKEVIDVNLIGAFNMMKATSRVMMRQRYGRIINLSSVSGIMGNIGQTNYAAAKAGIIGMTKSYAKEVAKKGITVNAVAPGFIETDMTKAVPSEIANDMIKNIPVGHIGKPEDIAEAVCFLAGERAGYITGELIRVDGGMAM